MLDYQIINLKPTITDANGVEYIDLMSSVIDPSISTSGGYIYVNKYYVARPDLVSLAVYGNDMYADIICKINGISNPFEMAEDTLLFLPDVEYLTSCLKGAREKSELVSANATAATKDKIGNEIRTQKLANEARGVNEQVVGDANYIINKQLGLIFY